MRCSGKHSAAGWRATSSSRLSSTCCWHCTSGRCGISVSGGCHEEGVAPMKGIAVLYRLVTLGALAIGIAVPYLTHEHGSAAVPGWQSLVNPGNLSAKHQFLAATCEACHTPHVGATADKCLVCHANARALLATQPTAFHATVGVCQSCHVEHLGVVHRPITMDHVVLARIGARKA